MDAASHPPDPTPAAAPALSRDALAALLTAEFPQLFKPGSGYTIDAVWLRGCRVSRSFHADHLRPGGTISGPTLMELADFSLYVAVLGSIGWKPLAVTTNLSINFLRKPSPRDLVAEGRLLKLGKRLAVGEVTIFSAGEGEPVAHATGTYSIPP